MQMCLYSKVRFPPAEGLIAYVEWAPLTRVRASNLISACAYLLSVPDHRMAAANVMRELSARKQLQVNMLVFISALPMRSHASEPCHECNYIKLKLKLSAPAQVVSIVIADRQVAGSNPFEGTWTFCDSAHICRLWPLLRHL